MTVARQHAMHAQRAIRFAIPSVCPTIAGTCLNEYAHIVKFFPPSAGMGINLLFKPTAVTKFQGNPVSGEIISGR